MEQDSIERQPNVKLVQNLFPVVVWSWNEGMLCVRTLQGAEKGSLDRL